MTLREVILKMVEELHPASDKPPTKILERMTEEKRTPFGTLTIVKHPLTKGKDD